MPVLLYHLAPRIEVPVGKIGSTKKCPVVKWEDSMTREQIVEDWPTVKKRWEAWWECELYDRAVICVTAPLTTPRDDILLQKELNVAPKTQWTDANYIIHRMLEVLRTTYYGGEAIPWCWNPISAGHALYFGCEPHFAHDTMWVNPVPVGEDGYPSLKGWRESAWWRLARTQTEAFSLASKGRFFVLPFWGNHAGDILAVVRGVEKFYLDFSLNHEWVRSAIKTMSDILIKIHQELWSIAYSEITGVEGSLNYNGCWSPIRTMSFDCDISCNISPEAFMELILPPLVESMHMVDHRIYHLDGPGALHHLETLLGLPELHAIQWVPGAGKEEIMRWLPLIQRIQSKGKGVQVSCRPEEVELLMKQVRPEGLCITTWCRTEKEARELLKLVTLLSN